MAQFCLRQGKHPAVIWLFAYMQIEGVFFAEMQKFQEWGLENSVSVGKKQVGISFGPHLLSMWKPIHIKAAITVPSEKKKKKK